MSNECVLFNESATTEIYALSLHDALPISARTIPAGRTSCLGKPPRRSGRSSVPCAARPAFRSTISPSWSATSCRISTRSEEHTSELQSRQYLVCRLLLENKKHSGTQERRA